ncbi:uncharacterized protein LOC120000752 [Tripterygium wilfordii]|uniref:uncharacterized protein LOC120000752 n=1 Tax=Tripterygium wilfordii TaxID=458696 RepID=UPI0018F805FE|nr:uncharacterized protein LOC120000752 [Tripterygium wilfordii]
MVRFDELLWDVVQEISKKLTFLQDYIYLRATCRHFYTSIPPTPRHLPLQLPWLFYPSRQQNRRFFNFSTHKFHHLSFPNPSYHQREYGSSKGWLIILDKKSLEIVLINPLKGLEQEKVHLPALTSFPNVIGFNLSRTGREFEVAVSNERGRSNFLGLKTMRDRFIKKIIISSTPLKDAGFVAVALLRYHGEIMVCNLKSDPPTVSIIKMRGIPSEVILCAEMYLVGSEDELFLVLRHLDNRYYYDCTLSGRTRRFDAFRIDRSEQLARWIAVTDVGERALFVGQNESVCFMASEYRGCMGNCIYFTSNVDTMPFNDHLGEYDTGIYKLSDGTIESLPPCPRNLRPPPIWVTPNPY